MDTIRHALGRLTHAVGEAWSGSRALVLGAGVLLAALVVVGLVAALGPAGRGAEARGAVTSPGAASAPLPGSPVTDRATPETSSASLAAASAGAGGTGRGSAGADARTPADVQAGLLSLDVPTSARGELVVVPGQVAAPGPGAVRTVRVEVEEGLPVDPGVFASFVMTTLNDPRGWGAGGAMSFARTDGEAEIRVTLASPDLVDDLCAPLKTQGTTSCGRDGRATINDLRWVTGTAEFADNLLVYRQYVINHEVGHLLGHPHRTCPGAGELAPIMQQQTYGVAPCVPNGWPNP